MTARFRSKSIARPAAAAALALVVAAAPGAALAQQTAPAANANTRTATPAGVTPTTAVAAAPGVNIPTEYTIGADDVLSVIFWRDKELTADVTVRPDGMVSLPLMNDIKASGLTPAQLKDRIVDESKKYVEDPNVTVVVKQINSRKVFITGEVNKAGPYPLTSTTTVLQLLSLAGGFKEYAHTDKISIVRMENGKQTSFKFNYKDVINGKKLQQNIELKPNDTIIVP